WRQELVVDYSSPQWQFTESSTYGSTSAHQVFWLGNKPVLLFQSASGGMGGSTFVWMAQRESNGNWNLDRVTDVGFGIDRSSQVNPQRIAANIRQGGAGGSPIDWWILD